MSTSCQTKDHLLFLVHFNACLNTCGQFKFLPPVCLCTIGNRHRLYLVNSVEYYLPAPCYGLTDYTILAVMKDFLDSLIERGCRDCPQRNMFLLCPEVNQQTIFYDDVMESYTTNNN